MKRLIGMVLMVLALTFPARADETAIREVISSQIEAFKADDLETAFGFASPTIRGIFRTPDNFGTMVREGYPMVWRPADLQFLGTDTEQGTLWHNVMIRDAQGRVHVLGYQMIRTDDGWKINAVKLRKAPGGMV